MNSDLVLIGLLVLFFLLAVLFAAAEMSLTRVPEVRIRTMAEEGSRRARRLSRLLDQLPEVINAILLAVLLVQIGAATVTGLLAERWFNSLGIAIASVLLTIVLFVYTEAIPKTYAFRHPARVALWLVYPVSVLHFLARPVVRGLIWFADLHAPGKGIALAPTITERELLTLAADAEQEGAITRTDLDLIERAFKLGDRTAGELMVPRIDMVAVPITAPTDVAVTTALQAGHRRLIVYRSDLDEIAGIVYLRDLVAAGGSERRPTVESLVKPALVVSEWKRVVELLREMQEGGTHLAVVVDEYGGTAGMLTIEDIAEALLGAVADEGMAAPAEVHRSGPGRWLIDGGMLVDDLADFLDADLPKGDWTTVAGMVMGLAGEVPEEGAEVRVEGFRFRVDQVLKRRIRRVEVAREYQRGAGP